MEAKKMRLVMVMVVGFVMSTAAAYAEQPEIPTPPGAEVITEINLSDNDILGMIKQAIPAFTRAIGDTEGDIGNIVSQIDPGAFVEAIKDVTNIRIIQFKLSDQSTAKGTLDFFAEHLPVSEGWSRILYDASMLPKGAVIVYMKDGQDMFAAAVDPCNSRAFVTRTVGFVDLPRLAEWAGKTIKFFAAMGAKELPTEPEQTKDSTEPDEGAATGESPDPPTNSK